MFVMSIPVPAEIGAWAVAHTGAPVLSTVSTLAASPMAEAGSGFFTQSASCNVVVVVWVAVVSGVMEDESIVPNVLASPSSKNTTIRL